MGVITKNKKSLSIKVKITLGIMLFFLIVLGAIFSASFFYTKKINRDNLKSRLLNEVSIAVLQIDANEHSLVRTKADESSVAYQDIKNTLKKIKANSTDIHYIYTMRENEKGEITFVVDADDEDPNDLTHVGDVYFDANEFMRQNFMKINKPVTESGFTSDRWGTWISGFAPFYRPDGKREGVLGIDIKASNIIGQENKILLTYVLIFILAGVLSAVLGVFLGRGLSNSITSLTSILKEKKIEALGSVRSGSDEVGELTKALLEIFSKVKVPEKSIEENIFKKTEALKNLLRELEKFKLAVDNASDQVIITDAEGIVLYGNGAVRTITGFFPEEVIGKKAAVLWRKPMPQEYYKKMWDIIKNKKQTFVGEITNIRKNGEPYVADISISPILDDKGGVLYFVAIEHDITKEKEIEKAKTEFVSLASHQLKTPIGAMNWNLEMLLAGDYGGLSLKQKEIIEKTYELNKRMTDIINDFLNVSRIELGTFTVGLENIDLVSVCEEVLLELKERIALKKNRIIKNYQSEKIYAQADPKVVRIVFQNLLSNAVKYSFEAGQIGIAISLESNKVKITISNEGEPIPEKDKPRMFEKMFRAGNAKNIDPDGNGLGLYILKYAVDASGGKVYFESNRKGGTFFCVELPLFSDDDIDGEKSLS